MKKVIFLLAGVSFALGYSLVRHARTLQNAAPASKSVDDLAKTLQSAWADHHTVA